MEFMEKVRDLLRDHRHNEAAQRIGRWLMGYKLMGLAPSIDSQEAFIHVLEAEFPSVHTNIWDGNQPPTTPNTTT